MNKIMRDSSMVIKIRDDLKMNLLTKEDSLKEEYSKEFLKNKKRKAPATKTPNNNNQKKYATTRTFS